MKSLYHTLTKKQQKIFDVSVDLFYQKGYAETSVRDIAEVLDIQAASLYAHISSKEQILGWIAQNYLDLIEGVLYEFRATKMSASQQIRFMVRKNIMTIYSNMKYADIFRTYLTELPQTIQDRYNIFTTGYHSFLTNALKKLQEEENVQFDAAVAAKFLMHNLNFAYKWAPEEFTSEEIINIFENKILPCFLGKKIPS